MTAYLPYKATVLADSPIRYYRLGETSGTVATDLGSAAQNGTYSGGYTLNQASLLRSDTVNPCVLFNGTTGAVSLPTTGLPTGAGSWSMECWVKTPATLPSTGFRTVMMFGTNSGAGQASIGYDQPTNKFTLSSWSGNILSSATVTASTLYHLVGTYNGTTATFYVNGVSAGSAAFAYAIVASLAYIGTDTSAAADYWNSTIDEVAWYSTVLTASQVATHYSAGMVKSKDVGARFRLVGASKRDGMARYRLKSAQQNKDARARFGVRLTSSDPYANTVLADAPAAYYRLNELSGTSAVDISGNAYTGTINTTGITYNQTSVITTDNAMLFDGVAGKVDLPTALNYAGWGALTVECWAKFPTFPGASTYARLISSGYTASGNDGFELIMNASGASVVLQVGSGTAQGASSSGATVLATNTWYHLVGTFDGSNVRFYLNGTLTATTALTGTVGTSHALALGYSPTTSDGFCNVVLDEAAIYASVLSQARITAHYLAGHAHTLNTPMRLRQKSAQQNKDASLRFGLKSATPVTMNAPARFRQLATKSSDAIARWRLLATKSLDQLTRFRLQSGILTRDSQTRLRVQSALQKRDAQLRIRVVGPASLIAVSRLRLLAIKSVDSLTRFRQQSALQVRDSLARYRVQSGTINHDAVSRFSLRSVTTRTLDGIARLRLLTTKSVDTLARLRVQSSLQGKDAISRFRQFTAKSVDTLARLRVQSSVQSKDSSARYRQLAQRNADLASRFRQLSTRSLDGFARLRVGSPPLFKGVQARFSLLSIKSTDAMSRYRLQSGTLYKGIQGRFRQTATGTRELLTRFRLVKTLDTQIRLKMVKPLDGLLRFRLQLVGQVSLNVSARFRQFATKRIDTLARLRVQSSLQRKDAGARWRQQSGTTLRDTLARLRLQSTPQIMGMVTRLRLIASVTRGMPLRFRMLALRTGETLTRVRIQSTGQYRNGQLRLLLQSALLYRNAQLRLRLVIKMSLDAPMRFRLILAGTGVRDAVCRFGLIESGTPITCTSPRGRVTFEASRGSEESYAARGDLCDESARGILELEEAYP